jgi:hypothetical protein
MKKLSLFILLLFPSLFSYAQEETKHDVRVGIGFGTHPEFMAVLEKTLSSVFTLGSYQAKNVTFNGAYNVSYLYSVKPWMAIGADYSYENITNDVADDDGTIVGNEDDTYNTMMACVHFQYIRTKYFQLYSGGKIGISFNESTGNYQGETRAETNVYPAFQLTGVGLRFGNRFAGTMEVVSYGYEGIINAGLSYRF